MATELPELIVEDANAWRSWLGRHHADSGGVWLVLAKKGTAVPTRLTYDEALEEALSHGWIDGQLGRRDEMTYRQRFTPRGARSRWSKRNVAIAERLIREGRMHSAGLAAAEQARGDGRWGSAYAGSQEIEVPADLAVALRANHAAQAMFGCLSSRNRYAVLYRIGSAQRPETRARRVAQFVDMLGRGETIYPQGPPEKAT
ncbi:MAG: YdeI/OmpD-associated family protein [Candidatus Dormiibacterota bacterium]